MTWQDFGASRSRSPEKECLGQTGEAGAPLFQPVTPDDARQATASGARKKTSTS
jgi:hypothetical protein